LTTKTIRRPAANSNSAPFCDDKTVRNGDVIYVRTYAGPLVKLHVKEVKQSSFIGIVDNKDNEKTYLAGCERCDPTQLSEFLHSKRVSRKEYEEEDWKIWVVRKKML